MARKEKIDKHPGWQLSRSEKGWYYLGDSARLFCTALINTYMTTFLIFQGGKYGLSCGGDLYRQNDRRR